MRGTITFLTLCTALAALAQVPCKWTVDLARVTPADWDCLRGETVELMPSFVSGRDVRDLSGVESATLWWQTNGMGAAYWSAPASVDTNSRPHRLVARWTPEMDVGAASYRYFVGAAAPSGTQYRAHGTIRMRGAPGETPNALPLPIQVLDFAKIAWTNAPWGEGGGTLTEETDPVFGEWARTNALPHVTTNDVRAISLTRSEAAAGFTAWTVEPPTVEIRWLYDAWQPFHIGTGVAAGDPNPVDDPAATLLEWRDREHSDFDITATRTRLRPTPEMETDWNAKVAIDDLAPYATRSWTLSTYGGTNYWMAIDGKLLGVYSCTNAAAGTNTLWESSSAFGGDLADVAQRATNNTTRITALEARPDLTSWGDYAPDGTPNPDAEAMVYLNKALTLMGSGFSWATSGSYACLCQSGAVAFQVDNAGEIRIGTDIATNYFGLVQGGSVTVGCRTDGIRVADGVAYLSYAYAGGAFPVVWFCGDLAEGVWQETSPVWTDNGDGTATAAVPATGSRGFFKATSTRETGAYFRSNVPAHFPAGVYGALASEPVKYDSVITVQSGGHTYRIPAELVQ